MKVIQFTNGMLQSNVFLIISEGEAVLIDAGVPTETILNALEEVHATLKYIILTHAHVDHIWYADDLRKALPDVLLCVHEAESEAIKDRMDNLSYFLGQPIELKPADRLLTEGDTLTCGEVTLTILHTPGHSEGGISIAVEGHLFTGDTLFKGAWGRTDFVGGSNRKLLASIQRLLDMSNGDILVHAGHGADSTVAEERATNPYKGFLSHGIHNSDTE
ncbi:MAG: MBL fold metallo-hydrolase [Clostridia bacterium]